MEIKEIALKLKEIYNQKYIDWTKENPGKVMNGNLMKADALEKVSYCKTIEEVIAFKIYYEVALRSAKGPNGFIFSKEVVEELINLIMNKSHVSGKNQ